MHRSLSFLIAVLAAAAVVRAADPATNRLAEVVVTATRLGTTVEESPTTVTVITREAIAESQATRVQDVLATVPGAAVAPTGQPGGQTSVFLRGAESDHTLVLLDGIPINNSFDNRFDFAQLPVDNIERIEVLRGPQSTLYGSEAIGGVINIVTRRASDKPTGSATVEAGSYNSLRTRVEGVAPFGPVTLALAGSAFNTDNERDNAANRVRSVSGNLTCRLTDRLNAALLGTYLQSKNGVPDTRFVNDPNDTQRNENHLVALTLNAQPTEWWDTTLKLSAGQDHLWSDRPADPGNPFDFSSKSRTIARRWFGDWQHVWTVGEQHRLLVGGSATTVHADYDDGWAKFEKELTGAAGYLQYEFAPTTRCTLTVGGRLDQSSRFGTHGTYRCGARGTLPGTETIVRASYGTGFRVPTIMDLYYPGFSNPDLDPEVSRGWDVGVEQPLLDHRLRIGATCFQNELEDMIQPDAFWVPYNTNRARTAGLETFLAWTPLPDLTLRATYTWLPVAENLTDTERLVRRPWHTGSLSVHYAFLARCRADLNATYVGHSRDLDPRTWPTEQVYRAGYAKLDFALQVDLCPHFTVFGRVENLLDDRYEPVFGYPALGRTVWGGGTVKF